MGIWDGGLLERLVRKEGRQVGDRGQDLALLLRCRNLGSGVQLRKESQGGRLK